MHRIRIIRRIRRAMLVAALAALTPLLAACESMPVGAGAGTGGNLTDAADQLTVAREQLDATMASLDALMDAPVTELPARFDEFRKSVTALTKEARDVDKLTDRMTRAGRDYVQEWSEQLAEIKNETIRERSEQRQRTIEQQLVDLREEYNTLDASFQPLKSTLEDIIIALRTDLTIDGLRSVAPAADRARMLAEDTAERAARVAEQFRALGVSLQPAMGG
jgi:DNA repair exonuclease SbcCD ATPase subunit